MYSRPNIFRGIILLILLAITLPVAFSSGMISCAPPYEDPLTPEERQWLKEHSGQIRLAATPSTKPLEYFNEKGEYQGMVADYIRLLEKKLNFEFSVVQAPSLKELLRMAENREVDVIPAFAANPTRIGYMNFTRPYLVLPTVILVNKSRRDFLTLERMSGMDLALPKEYAVIDYVRKYHSDIHIQPVYNYLAALLHVSFNEIDATIISLPQASYYIEDKGITNLRVAGHTDYKIFNRIASRSDWPILNRIIQKGLDKITQAERDQIYRKWVTLEQHYISILLQNKRFWYSIVAGLVIILLSLVAIIFWNRTLHRRVNERTQELKKELQRRMRLMAAIEQAEDGIFILDTNQRLEYANPAFIRMSGYEPDEIIGRHISFIRGNDDPDFFRQLWEVLERGEVWRGQVTYRDKGGRTFVVDLSVSPIYGDNGEITNYVEVARDITEKLRMENQLRQSQKMEELGTLAGGIAHDFNNIIAAIQGYAELSLPAVEPDSRAEKNLERIIKVAQRAKEMVHQILIFSRRREPERRMVELGGVVEEVVGLLNSSLPSTIEIHTDIQKTGGTILADPSQIHQVIMNLGTNAAYAMRDTGGMLGIRLSSVELRQADIPPTSQLTPGRYMKLVVCDTGPGIPDEIINRIFDPFFTTKPQGEGTGMGLAMVHGIVGSMDGEITVKSVPGEGACFELLFPVVAEVQETPDVKRARPVRGRGSVLFVDDEEDLVEIGTQMLTGLGYHVTGTTDSAEALRLFSATPEAFDLVITDQTMPKMTGDRLAEAIHEIRPELPVILSTGFSAKLKNLDAERLGIRKMLLKPFELVELSKAVRDVLEE